MFHQELEALAVAVGVVRWRVGAIDFFRGMEDFEGEDGEAIDHEAGALRVEAGGRIRQLRGLERFEEHGVALFGEVVAALVEVVDGALDFGDIGVGGTGSAGPIFNVPKVEVGTVLGCDCVVERLPGNDDVERVIVPQAGGAVVKSGDFGSRKVEKFAHPGFEAMVEHQ